MTEMAPEAGARKRPGSEKKIFGLPRNVVIAGGVAFIAAAVYVWYRNRNSAASAASTQGTSADATGTDQSGEISTLQQEIQDLQGELAGVGSSAGGASGGGGTSGGGTSSTGSTGPGGTGSTGSAGDSGSGSSGDTSGSTGSSGAGTGSTGTTGTTGGSTTPTAAKKVPPPTPTNVKAVHVTANEIGLTWNPSPGATGYRIRITYQGQLAGSTSPTSPGGTVHGLTPDHTYTCHVAAVGPGGTSPETGGPIVKTPRA